MDLKLQGKRAIATVGSRGWGLQSDENSARVALLGRDPRTVEPAATQLLGMGYDAIGVAADTSQDDEVESAVAGVTERFGGIDILVNSPVKA